MTKTIEEKKLAAWKLVQRLLDPEDLGYSVGPIIRDYAREALGIPPCESCLAKGREPRKDK
jgi:hypothetical protein